MCFSAGVDDLCPAEGKPDEPLRIQLAGAITSHQANAQAVVGRTGQGNSSHHSLADVKALRRLCRLCKVRLIQSALKKSRSTLKSYGISNFVHNTESNPVVACTTTSA